MAGVLVGVGVGPGDPDLVTIKAAAVLAAADVVFVPVTETGETGRAEQTALFYAEAWRVERVVVRDRAPGEVWDGAVAAVAAWFAAHPGGTAAFATLGDPGVYSTFPVVAAAVAERVDVLIEYVPGITAAQDLAARSGMALVQGEETLAMVPMAQVGEALGGYDVVVAEKGGRALPGALAALRTGGRLDGTVYGTRLGLPDEDVRPAATLDPQAAAPHLATLIATPSRSR